MRLLLTLLIIPLALTAQQTPSAPVPRRTTSTHPLRYLISRPVGWKAGGNYPVVVVIPDAEREFEKTAQTFIVARGNRPYIVVVPEVVTAGPKATTVKIHQAYDYDTNVWLRVRAATDCGFDNAGMTALVADLRRLDTPTGKLYLTGWEAGGHVVWAQFFKHPAVWSGIAAISPNYIGRCMEDRKFASSPADSGPPARLFYGTVDSADVPGGILYSQWVVVQRIAAREGFGHLSEKAVPGKMRGPMATEVLAWFDSLRAAGRSGH